MINSGSDSEGRSEGIFLSLSGYCQWWRKGEGEGGRKRKREREGEKEGEKENLVGCIA